jgi:uncharacterized repeat protein (TIGR03847 family)
MEHLDSVDTFTAGTVGRPGRREFFLQVRTGAERINVKCEKQQAAALAQYLRKLLNDLPPAADRPLNGAMQMTPPDDVAFVLGPIGLAYELDRDRFVVQLEELVIRDEDDVDDDDPDDEEAVDRRRIRLFLSRSQARPQRSSSTPRRSSPPAARRACGAADRSTPMAIHAPA